MKITTNHKERELLSYWDLTPKELKRFGYIENIEEEGINRFFRYYGRVYDAREFLTARGAKPYMDGFWRKWDGYRSETYFSGILIRYARAFEFVIVGRYYC